MPTTDPLIDRDLDASIWAEVFGLTVRSGVTYYDDHPMPWTVFVDAEGESHNPIAYSTDGNAMLSLLQRFSSVTFDGHEGPPAYWHVAVWTGHDHTMPDGKAKGATPSIALCLAALAAVRATKEGPAHADD